MYRPILLVALTLSTSGGWALSARAQDAGSGREGVTRPPTEGREGVTRPAKPDAHEHEGPKSSAPT